jgi:hypothetical protein
MKYIVVYTTKCLNKSVCELGIATMWGLYVSYKKNERGK